MNAAILQHILKNTPQYIPRMSKHETYATYYHIYTRTTNEWIANVKITDTYIRIGHGVHSAASNDPTQRPAPQDFDLTHPNLLQQLTNFWHKHHKPSI